MEMHQVRYFLAVAETLNFTRAAERMNVAQPSLTRAILKLEDELGGPLFNRERNNTHLTELGRIMLPHLKAAAEAAEQARAQAAGFQKRETGQLIVAVEQGMALRPLLALLSTLAAEIRGLEISVVSSDRDGVMALLSEGKAECGLMSQPASAPDRLNAMHLFDDVPVIAFQHDHPFAEREAISMADLDGIDLIVLNDAKTAGRPARRHVADSLEAVAAMVREGLGCALLSESQAVACGLSFRPLASDDIRARPVIFATMAGRRHSPALQAIVTAVKGASWGSSGGGPE